jgi:2-amino-4-hydroxy-6-hydroxymethyldihydropteridine diphosphokinase
MSEVILLTGGNLGDRQAMLDSAREQIARNVGPLKRTSGLYETDAWGNTDQPAFLNQVLVVDTALTPEAVLEQVLAIESGLGRKRMDKWGPRSLDIDILFYEATIMVTERLQIPHPEIPRRRFVLEPLAEVAPGMIHPVLGISIRDLLAQTRDTLAVRRLG